ncbi:hypothetical protein D3C77_305520 [compost metagenome]
MEDTRHFIEHALRQVAAIGPRVGRRLVGFVQGLGGGQGLLGTEPELGRADLLQRAQVERQRWAFAHALDVDAVDLRGAGLSEAPERILRGSFVDTTSNRIADCGRGLPTRVKADPVLLQVRLDGPEWLRHKARDRPVALDHQAQGWRLHASHRQQTIEACTAAEQREQPTQVDAHQPISTGASDCTVVQRQGLLARTQYAQGSADRRLIQRGQPQAQNRPLILAALENLPGDHLAFAIGVGGDNHFATGAQQLADHLELASDLGLDHQLPAAGNDRQVVQRPALVIAIGFRRRSFQQMADAPGDGDVMAQQAAIAAAAGLQHPGDVAGLGWFLADEQAHTRALSVGTDRVGVWSRNARVNPKVPSSYRRASVTCVAPDGAPGVAVTPG